MRKESALPIVQTNCVKMLEKRGLQIGWWPSPGTVSPKTNTPFGYDDKMLTGQWTSI